MNDNDILVAICTKKEQCTNKRIFSTPIRSIFIAPDVDFQWKTSDWIIQEIGYAAGRGMPVIVLLEQGVREPGGIKGRASTSSFHANIRPKPTQR